MGTDKLPKAVEWLERNYDEYTLCDEPVPSGFGIDRATRWRPLRDELGTPFYEMGQGSQHREPMFTFRAMDESWADSYWWRVVDFVPLSLASEQAPLHGSWND